MQVLLWYLADACDQRSGYERLSGRTVTSAFKSVQQYERAARNLLLHHQIQGRGENPIQLRPQKHTPSAVSLNSLGFLVLCRSCRRWRGTNCPAARDWGLNWSRWSTRWLFPADRDWKSQCVFVHGQNHNAECRWCGFCVVFGWFIVECSGRLHAARTETLFPVLKRQWGRLGPLMKSCDRVTSQWSRRIKGHSNRIACLLRTFYYFVQMLSTLRSLCHLCFCWICTVYRINEQLPPSHVHDVPFRVRKSNGASVLTFTYSSVDEGEFDITQMTKRRKK